MANILRILPLLIMLLLSIALALGLFNKGPEDPIDTLHNGFAFSDFQIPSLKKDTVFSSKSFGNGQVVVVNVFASWCVPCASEHEVLMKLAHKVNIYGIAWRDTSDKVFEFLRARGNPFQQIGIDELGKTTVLMGITGVPETFILNKKGEIALHYKAPISDEILTKLIIPLIDKLNSEDVQAR